MARSSAGEPLRRLPMPSVSTASRCQANVLESASPIRRAAGSRYGATQAGGSPPEVEAADNTNGRATIAAARQRQRMPRNLQGLQPTSKVSLVERAFNTGPRLALCEVIRRNTAVGNGPDVTGVSGDATATGCDGDVMKVRASLLGLLLTLVSINPLGAGERLIMKVSPAVCFAPANLIVRAFIEADPANRAVEIVAESPEFYRSSEIQLDGEHAPRTNTFEFRSLPPGTYEVKAVLVGADGAPRATSRQQVNVIASGAGH